VTLHFQKKNLINLEKPLYSVSLSFPFSFSPSLVRRHVVYRKSEDAPALAKTGEKTQRSLPSPVAQNSSVVVGSS
jgi:hypothetical protein